MKKPQKTLPGVPGAATVSFNNLTASLHHPNYRLWFIGQVVSLFGTWMQTSAQGFFVYELTKSPAYLGYVAAAMGLPAWILMPYGGVIADRISRRTLLIMTQSALMFLALIMTVLTLLKVIGPYHILILALLQGIVNAFDAPARQSFVSDLVPREDMTNAIALNSSMFNIATVLGPAMGGIVYTIVGPGWCFGVNSVSFLAVIIALVLMKMPPLRKPAGNSSALKDIKAGLRYIIAEPMILTLIGLASFISLFGFSFVTLIPAWTDVILHGNATVNGLLLSGRGVGALLSAITIASLGRFAFRGKLLTVGTLAFPVLLFVFSFMRDVHLAVFFMVAIGSSLILIFNLANSLIQHLVEGAMRGRVMAIYTLTFFGFSPLGGLILGLAAKQIGVFYTVVTCSAIIFAFSWLVFFIKPAIRKL